jgi:molybdopterin converting factor small subunit
LVTVEYYGVLKGLVGMRSEEVPHAATVAGVIALVVDRHPNLDGAMQGVATALNEEIVRRTAVVADGAVLALLPPVSGG